MHRCNLAIRFRMLCSVLIAGIKSAWLPGWCFYSFSVSPHKMPALPWLGSEPGLGLCSPGGLRGKISAPGLTSSRCQV